MNERDRIQEIRREGRRRTMRNLAIAGAFFLGLVMVAVIMNPRSFERRPLSKDLPPHTVVSEKKIGLATEGRRRIEVQASGEITKAECVALLEAYNDRAGYRGQVVVKTKNGDGQYHPWCVDNIDGSPVIWWQR